MKEQYLGGCLCGSIRYSISGFHDAIANCHCTMCRKFTGAAYATYASVDLAAFSWLQGENLLKHYRADNGTSRSFCSHCGSGLVFTAAIPAADVIEIALGTLDGEVPISPDAHIYVENKANWVKLTDELTCHPQGRDDAASS